MGVWGGSGTGAEVTYGGCFENTFRSHLQIHGETMFQISRSWANRVRQEGPVNEGEIDRPTRSRTDRLTGRSIDRPSSMRTDRRAQHLKENKKTTCKKESKHAGEQRNRANTLNETSVFKGRLRVSSKNVAHYRCAFRPSCPSGLATNSITTMKLERNVL